MKQIHHFRITLGARLTKSRSDDPRGSSRLWLFAILLASYTIVPCFAGSFDENVSYQLGRGLHMPALDLTFSGYASLRAQNLASRDASFGLSDLSLFTIWEPGRWRFFAEIELEDAFSIDERGLNASDSELEIERLYGEYAFSDAANLRAGRYLTPFGRWNLLHADPLVWTVRRPLVTLLAIPDHGTGLLFYGQRSVKQNYLEYTVYLDDSRDLNPHHGETSFEEATFSGITNDLDNALGGQLRYYFLDDRAELGVSLASFSLQRSDGRRHLFGIDLVYRWRRAEFSMESAYRLSDDARESDEWGTFVQGVVPIVGRCYATARLEFYSGGTRVPDAGGAMLGLAYRPHPATTVKLEYHGGTNSRLTPDGIEASWSVLF